MSGVKCTSKKIKALSLAIGVFFSSIGLTACGAKAEIPDPFDSTAALTGYGIVKKPEEKSIFFADNLCVTDGENLNTENVHAYVAMAAGVFDATTKETLYKQDIFKKVYPASTTKIMTLLCAIKHGDLSKTVTVSENIANIDADSSVAGLNVGDQLTIRQLSYGLMLPSGNDAAIAIAEGVSGSVEAFAELMNQEAQSLGATHSHFVNPHGLQDTNHYVTVYDMYLIFNEALRYQDFTDVIQSPNYLCKYTDKDGNKVEKTWRNTVRYVSGTEDHPSGINVIGGKSGTTGAAKYCMEKKKKNAAEHDIISLVYGADARVNLYLLMREILKYAKTPVS